MSRVTLRRSGATIYDYPEHLNPFKEDDLPLATKNPAKEGKHKFWTFGRSRKKRSNSFSIKSTWSGLFGKKKEIPMAEKRSTITTVSSTYKRDTEDRPPVPARLSKDQKEFDEALGTLARRRKYTLDNSSRYSSSLTVNGDPARIYDGSPRNTTASIMGDLTPKAPVRRFGQVSPRPTDKIPPLHYEDKESKIQHEEINRDSPERTPVPPTRRSGNRSSMRRSNTGGLDPDEESNESRDTSLRDENENVSDDYVFKRFSQDAVRKSNLSINSCMSIGSTTSTYTRKKRRAPPPPIRVEPLENQVTKDDKSALNESAEIEQHIREPIDIASVTENIDELTKKSSELTELSSLKGGAETRKSDEEIPVLQNEIKIIVSDVKIETDPAKVESETQKHSSMDPAGDLKNREKLEFLQDASADKSLERDEETFEEDKDVEVTEIELRRISQDKLEFIKDVDEDKGDLKGSTGTLSRSDSFSVKDEIEKLERQIKALESKNGQRTLDDDDDLMEARNTRLSLQETRRSFFENMVGDEVVKIEFKKLPCEQNDIHVVRLTDPPVPVEAPSEPVKVIELHISEPIRHRPELWDEVNPIPKPRRHNSLNLESIAKYSKKERRSLQSSRENPL